MLCLFLKCAVTQQCAEAVTTDPPTESAATTEIPSTIGTFDDPASSCSDIPQDRPSGEYWIATDSTSSPVQVYCDMNRTSCSCNTAGGWMRIANLDMTDPNQNCPEGFNERFIQSPTTPTRICGRVRPTAGCVSTTYPTHGVPFSIICGRITGYREGSPDGIRNNSVDDIYLDGVSLTYGMLPREHIWSFVGGEINSGSTVPSFVGNDYFCGINDIPEPNWAAPQSSCTHNCCIINNPPWFCKQLPQPTTDNIELRICGDDGIVNEDTPIELVEIYVR